MIQFDEHIFQMGCKKPPTSFEFLFESPFSKRIVVSEMGIQKGDTIGR